MEQSSKIEKAYYKAIAAAKVDKLHEYDTEKGPLRYSRNAFLRWARQIDIYDLEKEKADFALTKAMEDDLTKYGTKMEEELRNSFKYVQNPSSVVKIKGRLENIGSCHDGTKVGEMDEVDSYYILENDNITVKQEDNSGAYKIFWHEGSTNFEIEAHRLRNQFADACDKSTSEYTGLSCLSHGGYNSPYYSGVRYNGPAATPQFLSEDDKLLTLDITPAFRLPGSEKKISQEVKERLDPIRNVITDKGWKDYGIHLIPDGVENLWRLSTAIMEANILRILHEDVPVKMALSYCKIVLRYLKEWNALNIEGFALDMDAAVGEVMEALDKYFNGQCRSPEVAKRLNREMRYAHPWIQLKKRKPYKEDGKSYISINNAAVKNILLSYVTKTRKSEAFSDKKNMDLVVELMKEVFHVLGDTSQVSLPRTFLTIINVQHLSILASQEKNKMAAAGWLIKEQCRTLELKTMTVVG